MIEIAQAVDPFGHADEVLASREPWVVVDLATGKHLIICQIRDASSADQDSVVKVRIDAERRYHELCWIKKGGALRHKGQWAAKVVGKDSRYWAIVQRLWEHLGTGRIPATVQIWPDEAFHRERLAAFQAAYPDVWRELIKLDGYRKFNEDKLGLVRKFGRLTDKEIASIRGRKRKLPKPPKAASETGSLPRSRDFEVDDEIH